MRVLSINNDDVCLQDGAFSTSRRDHVPGYAERGYDPYIRGYSRGRQRAWLEAELATARADGEIDWIVVGSVRPPTTSRAGAMRLMSCSGAYDAAASRRAQWFAAK